MEAPAMETVYQAISALFDNPNATEKEKASRWLGDVQKSLHSWKIADELLQQKKDVHSYYFAAQTMRSKVLHNLSELPSESLVSLRNSLIAHLEGVSAGTNSPILTQLCLALADLALQMPSWENSVSDILKLFTNKNDFALLEILTVLPQEIDSSYLKLGENRRADVKIELRQNSQAVTAFLKESITNQQNTHVVLQIIKCMTSWIQVSAIDLQDVPQNAVIGLSLQILRDYNSINTLHDAASDCVCALLHCLEESRDYENIERMLFDSITALEESYHLAVAHEEEEKTTNYARVFTELAEAFLNRIIQSASTGSTHYAIRSLDLVLVCVGHHDYEVAEITFNLWYRLSEEVYEYNQQPMTDGFKPHIERLIEALARHSQCEPDLAKLPEEGDDFYEFRVKVTELIKDVVFIVGSSSVFRQMFTALHANTSWEQTEAALFVMQAVAKNILPEEYEYVPKVVEAILSMPENTHLAVRKTCILLLGELCEWIEQHPECVATCVQTLLLALNDPQLALPAAKALQSICAVARSAASGHSAALLAASARPLPSAATAAAVPLTRALAAALGALPREQVTIAMREAAAPILNALSKLTASTSLKEVKKGTDNDPVFWLDRLAALFRDVQFTQTTAATSHPCMAAFNDAWPVLQDVMDKLGSCGRVTERWCRAVRFMCRCGGRHAAPLAPSLATTLATLYAARKHSALLYLASVLVDELAVCAQAHDTLIGLLQVMIPHAFQLLQQPDGLKNNPDTVDDLFRLCIRFLQRIPLVLLRSAALPAALRLAALAAKLDHRDANNSVMKFLYDLARAANSTSTRVDNEVKALANETLEAHHTLLATALLEAAVLHLHGHMLGEVAEALGEVLMWARSHGREPLAAALAALPRPPHPAATEHQCQQFHTYAMRAEKFKELTRLLREFAKLYR